MDLSREITNLLQHFSAAMSREFDRVLLAELGLGLAQYRLISVVEARKYCRQKELAEELALTEAAVSRQVRLVQAEGWLEIIINDKNRRERHLALTARGAEVATKAHGILASHQRLRLGVLSYREQVSLLNLLRQIYAGLLLS